MTVLNDSRDKFNARLADVVGDIPFGAILALEKHGLTLDRFLRAVEGPRGWEIRSTDFSFKENNMGGNSPDDGVTMPVTPDNSDAEIPITLANGDAEYDAKHGAMYKSMQEVANSQSKSHVAGDEQVFIASFETMAYRINGYARDKGWWDSERNDAEMIALMHSELSEALEGLRHGNPPDDKVPEFSSLEAEFADVIIRIMDMAHARGLRLAEAIIAKHKYNLTRPRKHGKEF